MKIRDRLEFKQKGPILCFSAEQMIMVAVRAMSEKNYGAAVIIDEDRKPVGIITERDFMRRVLDKGVDANTTPISAIMTRDLKVAHEDDNLVDWLQQMSNERFRHLPVVDAAGRIIGIMSQGDFVAYTWPELLLRVKNDALNIFSARSGIYLLIAAFMIYSLLIVTLLGGAR